MPILRPSPWLAVALACGLTVAVSAQTPPDSIARAKEFYASADYDQALQILTSLQASARPADATEIAAYRVFCLVALGRNAEAKQAAEAMVRANPLYHPPEADTSPRVRTFFEDVRRPLLPEVARQVYGQAKSEFDHKDVAAAAVDFDHAISIIDEIGPSDVQAVADLRTLAAGFRDLSQMAVAAAAPPPAPAAAAEAPVPARIYDVTDVDVTLPAAIARTMPPWRPSNPLEQRRDYRGVVEIVVDETGKVVDAKMTQNVNASYDPALLDAAKTWTFRPAMKGGVPVKYRIGIDVHLAPTATR